MNDVYVSSKADRTEAIHQTERCGLCLVVARAAPGTFVGTWSSGRGYSCRGRLTCIGDGRRHPVNKCGRKLKDFCDLGELRESD